AHVKPGQNLGEGVPDETDLHAASTGRAVAADLDRVSVARRAYRRGRHPDRAVDLSDHDVDGHRLADPDAGRHRVEGRHDRVRVDVVRNGGGPRAGGPFGA